MTPCSCTIPVQGRYFQSVLSPFPHYLAAARALLPATPAYQPLPHHLCHSAHTSHAPRHFIAQLPQSHAQSVSLPARLPPYAPATAPPLPHYPPRYRTAALPHRLTTASQPAHHYRNARASATTKSPLPQRTHQSRAAPFYSTAGAIAYPVRYPPLPRRTHQSRAAPFYSTAAAIACPVRITSATALPRRSPRITARNARAPATATPPHCCNSSSIKGQIPSDANSLLHVAMPAKL